MKTVYIDEEFRCHMTPADGRSAVETDFFDGKCDIYIEGYRFIPSGASWAREDGTVFAGEMIAPWKDWNELDAEQREYERKQYEAIAAELADAQAALEILGVSADG